MAARGTPTPMVRRGRIAAATIVLLTESILETRGDLSAELEKRSRNQQDRKRRHRTGACPDARHAICKRSAAETHTPAKADSRLMLAALINADDTRRVVKAEIAVILTDLPGCIGGGRL